MKRFVAMMIGLTALAACEAAPPQLPPREPVRVGETTDGRTLYTFRLTRSNALGVTPVSDAAIVARAQEICPNGFEELAREGQAERRISGVIYTDVEVTVLCR